MDNNKFSEVTVVAIHGKGGIKNHLPSLNWNRQNLPGSHGLIVSNIKLSDDEIKDNDFLLLPDEMNLDQYQDFMIYCLHRHIHTDFALTVQSDGWILNTDNWNDVFFDFDYIGAPTHGALCNGIYYRWYEWWGKQNPLVVQNGGFSLRSKNFLEAPSRYGVFKHLCDFPELNNEDVQLSCFMRPTLERLGFRYAPIEVARLFSFEHLHPVMHEDLDIKKIFGQHSRFRELTDSYKMLWKMPDEVFNKIAWEDKVLDLFKHYNYEISTT